MNSANDLEQRAAQVNGAVRQKCPVCNDAIGERCFCKIHSKEGEPIMLCCPSCAIQYFNTSRPPADSLEAELRAYEKNTHLFVAEEKPWL
jgi:hypothetical protein